VDLTEVFKMVSGLTHVKLKAFFGFDANYTLSQKNVPPLNCL